MVEQGSELVKAVVVLAAGVVAVPLFRRLGLGSVLGYLVAGLAIGPSCLGFFTEAGTVLHIAELGVVMFLFVIGLEMQPRRLWGLRHEIFGIGLVQVAGCGLLLTGLGRALGLAPAAAFVAAMGFVLSSTAIVMQILDERGQTSTVRGQRVVSILLLEDLAIVPLLAAVAALAPARPGDAEGSGWLTAGAAVAAIVGLVLVARFLLNPLFRILARSHAREVMTAAALLVVLGAALAMEWGGLSMALGAFAAGVMLSESTFRHQLEADIEPFRGILLGLFFIGVGMSLDLGLVREDWPRLLAGVLAAMALKATGIWVFARLFRAGAREATERAAMMAQGGEFAFVLYGAAAAAGIVSTPVHALLTAAVILSMALTPLAVLALRWLPRPAPAPVDMRGVTPVADAAADALQAAAGPRAAASGPDAADAGRPAGKRRGRPAVRDAADGALDGNILIIGFGRFGQIASQVLLARGLRITIIEHDTDMIRSAANFGFHAYYGDGTRMDVLHAGGAAHACAILVCTDRKETTSQIVALARHAFPLVPILARAYDRQHAISLLQAGAAVEMRETFESALAFGAATLRELGTPEDAIDALARDIRQRDAERLQLQLAAGGDITRGRHLMHGNRWMPTPLTKPAQEGQALNPEAAAALREGERDVGASVLQK